MSSSYPIPAKLRVLDSHTGGEPTGVVVDASLDLGSGSMAARRDRFRADFDRFRSAVVNEPRGSEAVVGALLCEPVDPTCDVGAIFFNNVGFLGMCGHATIGLGVSLAQTGRLEPGQHRLDTPVGVVPFEVHEDRRSVTLENIVSYRTHAGVEVTVRGRTMSGEVAWGGNWFYLVDDHGQELEPENAEELTEISLEMRAELEAQGIAGDDGAEVDHVELMGPSPTDGIDGRSFVLCPGGAWDRSPCGTGTSAKVACLAADGKLAEGEIWRQESLIGSVFDARYRFDDEGRVVPIVTGSAWVTAESTLIFEDGDPLREGLEL